MSRYNTHDFQNGNGKRFREDHFDNLYRHQSSQNYDMRNDTRLHTQPIHHDYDRINIYSLIKDIEKKHFTEINKLKNDIHQIDDIIHNLKTDKEKDGKYIAELEQNLAKERILKEKYRNSEKNYMQKIVWLESSNNDMKSLLEKFSQQIPYTVQISPTNKDNQEKNIKSEIETESEKEETK